jgi:hypothetical protein
MTATTITHGAPKVLPRATLRLLLAVLVAATLLSIAFVVGRASAPTHTVTPVVAVPAAVNTPEYVCRIGRPC